jgi:hypothetical protein
MKRLFKSMGMALILICLAALLAACGGGGGGGSAGSSPATASGTGSVAVLITDGPSVDMDALWLTITKVSLIPADDGKEVVIYDDQTPDRVNVLAYKTEDEPFFLTLKNEVPAGSYSKIRLEIENIEIEGGPCADKRIKLPSGKIDLNPRGGFHVDEGETIAIQLDFDANKWINLHEAGNSGKCILRPVIFVDIHALGQKERCPKIVKGAIEAIGESKILLKPEGNRGTVWVILDETTVVIDATGAVGDKSDLNAGDTVFVRGRLTSEGLLASLVVEGDLLKVSGTAHGVVQGNVFPFTPDPGEEVIGNTSVQVSGGTLVLLDCNTEGSINDIGDGTRATVVGKLDLQNGLLIAVAVLIESTEVVGELTDIIGPTSSVSPAYQFVITTPGGSETIVVSDGTPISLIGNGALTIPDLQKLSTVCGVHPKVRVFVDSSIPDPKTALSVRVYPEELTGIVRSIALDTRIIELDVGGSVEKIQVADEAKIIKSAQDSLDLAMENIAEHIGENISVTVFGIPTCTEDAQDPDFVAHAVVWNGSL